ncbi:MAG: AtpZ/AtpI family protein [Candidatus Doudnabacteria bacterium]|nr:AtpZ/AtpI family protein [Candidatus Doudnabacteria bacterium]
MPKENDESDNYPVPGRMSLDQLHKEQAELKEAKAVSQKNPGPRLLNAMSMFSVAIDFALILSLPLVAFSLLGRWLDNRYNQKFFVIIGLLFAIFVSSVAIAKQINKLSKLIKKK